MVLVANLYYLINVVVAWSASYLAAFYSCFCGGGHDYSLGYMGQQGGVGGLGGVGAGARTYSGDVVEESVPLTYGAVPQFVTELPGDKSEYFDVFGTGNAEWRLVFRGTADIGSPVLPAYKDGSGIPQNVEDACKTIDWSKPCTSHYRNSNALDKWADGSVQEVLFGVVDGGALVKTAIFRGLGSSSADWFSKDRLIESSWEDLPTAASNFFSIDGDGGIQRRFFMSHKYAGCPKDDGWFVAVDKPNPPCDWEKEKQVPVLKYSAGTTRLNWNSEGVKSADAMVVFVRYFQVFNPETEYFDVLGSGVKEWRLAFRGTAATGNSVFDAYKDGSNVPVKVDEACKQTDWARPCSSHYRNFNALDNWQDVDQILFGVVDRGALVKTIIFNGKGTNYMNWFGDKFLQDADWRDMANTPKNYFAIEGHGSVRRRFYISHKYNGCPGDTAWFVAIDTAKPPCQWEKGEPWPFFKYSAGPTTENQNVLTVRKADAFVVFLKYAKK